MDVDPSRSPRRHLPWQGRVTGDALPRLLCVGRIGWRSEDFLIDSLSDPAAARIVELRSDVADRELAYLYQTCRFTVYPSLYEGWGLLVSESLSYGKLCVCSRTSAIPEAGGDLAIYIDPLDLRCGRAQDLLELQAAQLGRGDGGLHRAA